MISVIVVVKINASILLRSSLAPSLMHPHTHEQNVIQEPLWMALFAHLVEKNLFSVTNMEKTLFGLCRYEAWRMRKSAGEYMRHTMTVFSDSYHTHYSTCTRMCHRLCQNGSLYASGSSMYTSTGAVAAGRLSL
jgi:hypothetical protein